ncbi:hypothetical protein PIROE2DRAFT_1978 [Piromyces sp. E2]|nr:hypothetical protein PIROE2DRAFT_1978 [Piromyces sp. E2]|eukprot:OUM70029.1 hypothetical protein PIROE2DRAFT_1978 [Piromyces sp. E2]
MCNSLLKESGNFLYYFIYNNNTNIVNLNHITIGNKRGILININNSELINDIFVNKEYVCSNEADFDKNTITYYESFKIEVPIDNNKKIILKSMNDIKETNNEQTGNMICSIYDELLKIAKPEQTNEGSFEDIINECCDIIDYSFNPNCTSSKKIKFNVGSCNVRSQLREISYLNCKYQKGEVPEYIENKNEKCIILGGFKFLLLLTISSMIMDISVLFWIGELKKYKCIIRIWTMIIGITGLICAYSIKSEIIISVYHNKNITKYYPEWCNKERT